MVLTYRTGVHATFLVTTNISVGILAIIIPFGGQPLGLMFNVAVLQERTSNTYSTHRVEQKNNYVCNKIAANVDISPVGGLEEVFLQHYDYSLHGS